MGGFFFTLAAALAGMERRLIGERTKAALAHKKSKSEKTGGDIPFGYDLAHNAIHPWTSVHRATSYRLLLT